MKRAIFILSILIFALVLWVSHSTNESRNGRPSVENSEPNAASARVAPKHSSNKVRLESDSTNSAVVNEDSEPESKELSREQVEAYLLKTKRCAECLINAFDQTGDTNFLAEAAENFSDNPVVQWNMLFRGPPEDRPKWLEKLKAASPDNSLPNYLSALDSLKAGKVDTALSEMDAASKKNYSTFEQERMQSREEMFLLAGLSSLEARHLAMFDLRLPNLAEMKGLAREIDVLQQKYKAAGDMASAQQLAAVGIEASRKLNQSNASFLIDQGVGAAMENIALKNLDANSYYDFLGKTAGARIEELKNQREESRELQKSFTRLIPTLSDTEQMIYLDRVKLYGELNAMRWLKRNYGSETK